MACLQREAPSPRQDLNIVAFVFQTIELSYRQKDAS